MKWIKCADMMPEVNKDGTSSLYIVCTTTGRVTAMTYSCNPYAKTEKGKAPKWKWMGQTSIWEPAYWMPLPPPPIDSKK